jgi:predicted nucleotidyltransferase
MSFNLVPMEPQTANAIVGVLQLQQGLDFAVLVGSRATGKAGPQSDWDIAIQWRSNPDWFRQLGETESLRHQLAHALRIAPDAVDLIDTASANLAMRAAIANAGIPLLGQESLAWAHFLQRTWRELEDFYWDKRHAA